MPGTRRATYWTPPARSKRNLTATVCRWPSCRTWSSPQAARAACRRRSALFLHRRAVEAHRDAGADVWYRASAGGPSREPRTRPRPKSSTPCTPPCVSTWGRANPMTTSRWSWSRSDRSRNAACGRSQSRTDFNPFRKQNNGLQPVRKRNEFRSTRWRWAYCFTYSLSRRR